MKRVFVTGIGTHIGKTLVSALLVKALEADYWKPIQVGNLDQLDSHEVARLVGATPGLFQPERWLLPDPVSAHLAALRHGVQVEVRDFTVPDTGRNLVIEGAGGLLVPLNNHETIADLILHCACPVVVVSSCYLGSINHTLLTIEALIARKIPIAGLVFNGQRTPGLEELIVSTTKLPGLLNLPAQLDLTHETIAHYAAQLLESLISHGLCTLG
jgi:dethiobiotin synthetase